LDDAGQRAVGHIYVGYREMLCSAARRILDCREAAEDLVHDAFAQLPVLIGSYRHQSLGGWLRKIVVNWALMLIRSRRRHEALITTGVNPDADAGEVESDRHELIRRALRRIPVSLREVVVLRFFLGMGHAQVGDTLGITVTASELRLYRGLRQLRRHLDRMEEGTGATTPHSLRSDVTAVERLAS
jgi:RNA polymerase sigma-70 factor (ECF subfamily)